MQAEQAPNTPAYDAAAQPVPIELARTVHRMQATGHLRCVNCSSPVGETHSLFCHAYAQARSHLQHMTDGRWHDVCWMCQQRREFGGTGLEPRDV